MRSLSSVTAQSFRPRGPVATLEHVAVDASVHHEAAFGFGSRADVAATIDASPTPDPDPGDDN